jgi:hypothetical protein
MIILMIESQEGCCSVDVDKLVKSHQTFMFASALRPRFIDALRRY